MNYFDDIDKAYENFILKVVTVINIWLQVKTNALKVDGNTGLMLKSWKNNRGTNYSKKKKSCLHVHKNDYKEARNELQKLNRTNEKVTLKGNWLRILLWK